MPEFTIGDRDFLLDGRPVRIISGALHYFRVHPEQWADRLAKARMMGLNTVETYVPWNAHAPEPGEFRLDGGLDLPRFLDLAAEHDLHAIVRPGPYICAEWDNGGLPGWLTRDPSIRLRTGDPRFLAAVAGYFDRLLPVLAPAQVTRGGPVLAVQVENEYGAYGDDPGYLRALADLLRRGGIDVPLFTCDQADDAMLARGGLPELHRAATFGGRVAERLAALRRHQPVGPLMCAEFWNGWFDHWGGIHRTTPAADSARALDELLAAGASVNIYLLHGGSNFGLTNGANDKGVYRPTVTSYDYDAPLSEAGEPTEKYAAYREVIARYAPVPELAPSPGGPAPAFPVRATSVAPVLAHLGTLGTRTDHDRAPTMDEVGQYRGFLHYRTVLATAGPQVLSAEEVRDRAQVFVDGVPSGVLSREFHDTALTLAPARAGAVLDILVEDQGRVNYGPRIGEHKGLIGPVAVDGTELHGWQVHRLDLDAHAELPFTPLEGPVLDPAFYIGEFEADGPVDLHLALPGWGKGVAWVNGWCLGRYWRRGPQRTLYVPGPVVRDGRNRLTVLELESVRRPKWEFRPGPELGPIEE
ncbi:glycoside hydrolase family 35 protein [Marinactinospora rubrisoli]|uniref:Beta-galactosidase family protein n=1 Tax=Marinactinospora rubrisoli TaxID=2715399 RepID=A0ABW2KAF9_9ACTN